MIDLNIENKIAVLTLNRPEKRNALNDEMAAALLGHLRDLANNDACKILVIKAKGESFCAGADLEYLQRLQKNSYEENLADSKALMQMFKALSEFPKITISQVEGAALAGGCGLAGLCDFCFATPEAKFGYTELRIGFIPAIVSVFLGPKIGDNLARQMLLTADIYSAEQALKMNLVTGVVGKENITAHVDEFANRLVSSVSAQSVKLIKDLLLEIKGKSPEEQLELAATANARARGTEDCRRGIQAFLDKEKIQWN